jgi:hypothetical protein
MQGATDFRHGDAEGEGQSFVVGRHQTQRIRRLLAAVEPELQSQRLPRNSQFATDDLHHALQNLLFDLGHIARFERALALAS